MHQTASTLAPRLIPIVYGWVKCVGCKRKLFKATIPMSITAAPTSEHHQQHECRGCGRANYLAVKP